MKKVIAIFALLLLSAGVAPAQEGRHFVLQGDDALVPIGITEDDSLELGEYHGDWNRFSGFGTFTISPDAHIDFSNVRELRNLMVNNTKRFVNNGTVTLRGEPVKMGELATLSAGEGHQVLLDIRGGMMLFENTIFDGNGNFVLPVREAVNQDGTTAGVNAVGGKLLFEGGTLAAPVYITLEYADNGLPFAASEVVVMRGVSLDNALNPDLAVVLQNPVSSAGRMRLVIEQRLLDGETAHVWKVEAIK